jgi:methylenetetrahydrofolate dehydrogenase (NADP+)/methenyltetrahydrofolate cyclohydrolase
MEEKLINGKELSDIIKTGIAQKVTQLKEKSIFPALAVILVGDDPASAIYVSNKEKACEKVGIFSKTFKLNKDISQDKVIELIKTLNNDAKYHTILVQLPLPPQIDESCVIRAVNPVKDADCLHPENIGKLVIGIPYVLPCTPAGIIELIAYSGTSTEGKHAVIIGRSNIVGKPMANLLMQKSSRANATVTVVHSRTEEIEKYTRQADILIAAMGKAEFVKAYMVKENAVIIDVGQNTIPANNTKGFKLVGDVDFDSVLEKVSKITPVPGGVGPMTIAMLLQNTITATEFQTKHC